MTHTLHDGRCALTHTRDPQRPRPAKPGTLVCVAHYSRLEQMIAESPALDTELVRAHTSSIAPQNGEKVSSSRTPGLNIRPEAFDARADLRLVLIRWADHTAQARQFTRPRADAPLEHLAVFLLRNLQWIVSQNDNGWLEAQHDRLQDAHRQARRIVQPAEHPHTLVVSRCVEAISCNAATRTPNPCPGTLHVVFVPMDQAANPDIPSPDIWCDACGIRYEAQRWYSLSKRVQLATAGAA